MRMQGTMVGLFVLGLFGVYGCQGTTAGGGGSGGGSAGGSVLQAGTYTGSSTCTVTLAEGGETPSTSTITDTQTERIADSGLPLADGQEVAVGRSKSLDDDQAGVSGTAVVRQVRPTGTGVVVSWDVTLTVVDAESGTVIDFEGSVTETYTLAGADRINHSMELTANGTGDFSTLSLRSTCTASLAQSGG